MNYPSYRGQGNHGVVSYEMHDRVSLTTYLEFKIARFRFRQLVPRNFSSD